MYLTHTTLMVTDQDKALAFYTKTLGFEKKADVTNDGFRWLTVAAPGTDVEIVLLKNTRDHPKRAGPDRWIIGTDDCRRDFHTLEARGVNFEEDEPADGYFGLNATFADPDGNRFMLRQAPNAQVTQGRVVAGKIVAD